MAVKWYSSLSPGHKSTPVVMGEQKAGSQPLTSGQPAANQHGCDARDNRYWGLDVLVLAMRRFVLCIPSFVGGMHAVLEVLHVTGDTVLTLVAVM